MSNRRGFKPYKYKHLQEAPKTQKEKHLASPPKMGKRVNTTQKDQKATGWTAVLEAGIGESFR